MKKYILVSGGSGYIGSNVIKNLIGKNYKVISVDINKNLFKHKNLKNINGDVNDYNFIYKKLKNYSISYIYHFAAISDIDFSVGNPKKTLNNNIFPTYNLLKISLIKKIKRFFFASTIYSNSSQGSYYRISKSCSEEIIEEFSRLHGLNYTIIRYGSLFGDLKYDNTINSIIKCGLNNKAYHREGSGSEMRNYIDIKDATELTVNLINKRIIKSYYNIYGKESLSFKQIIEIIKNDIPNLKVNYSMIKNTHHYIKSPFYKKKNHFYNLSVNKKNYFATAIKKYTNQG